MKKSDQLSENLLTGLIFACPLGQSKSNCPFVPLRSIAIERRLEIIDHYSVNQQERILRHHRDCLCKYDIFTSRGCSTRSKNSIAPADHAIL